MINLENKVVLVRVNTDYPENSPKKWHIVIGGIEKNEDGIPQVEDGETYFVDAIVGGAQFETISCLMPNGLFKHNLLFTAPQFDIIKQGEEEVLVAVIGKITQEQITEESTEESTEETTEIAEESTPINPETELDAE